MRPARLWVRALVVATTLPIAAAAPVLPPRLPGVGATGHPHPVPPRITTLPAAGVDPTALAVESAPPAPRLATASLGVLLPRFTVLTAPRSTARFDLLGLTWRAQAGPHPVDLAVRVRESGRWSPWQDLPVADDGPDAGSPDAAASAGRISSAPLLTGDADGVQVRVSSPDHRPPADLRIHLVDPGSSPADADPAGLTSSPAAAAFAATGRPAIITRAQWGADESLRSGTPTTNDSVKALFLHHTDGINTYTPARAAAQVRSVYAFHTRVRGWSDIGYNFLVDRFGRVYEGRAGSITAPIRGAHTGGFNANALGIATMGNFDVARPPAAMLTRVKQVMAWQAATYGINPRGTVVLTSAGGGTSRYPAGRSVRVNTISGHRDVGATACPGRYLYPLLGSIRSAAALLMRPGLAAAAVSPRRAAAGQAVIGFTGRIPTTQRWLLTLTSTCGAVVRTITGRSTQRITAGWDLNAQNGSPALPGVYRMSLSTWSPVGRAPVYSTDVEVLPTSAVPVGSCPTQRVHLGDVYATSVSIGVRTRPAATTAVIAAGDQDHPVEALLAAPLARAKGGPLLLTRRDALPAPVVTDLQRRGVTTVWIVGGTGSVSPAVQIQLAALGVGTVTRLAGATLYATAAEVARQIGAPGAAAVLASVDTSGSRPAGQDLATAAALAGATARPLLLANRTGVPSVTLQVMRDLGVRRVDLVGPTSELPARVLTQLRPLGLAWAWRSTGRNGAEVATAVALRWHTALGRPGLGVQSVSGAAHADGALAASTGRLVLQAEPGGAAALAALRRLRPSSLWVVGPVSQFGEVSIRRLDQAAHG